MFSWEFCEIFKNTYFEEHLWTAASGLCELNSLFWVEIVKNIFLLLTSEAVARRCSVKKVLLEISQNSQENTCARVSFLIKLQASCNFIKKETLAQVFSSEFCEISKNTFSYRAPLVAASVLSEILPSKFLVLLIKCSASVGVLNLWIFLLLWR